MKERFRTISFKEFCDEWLDKMNENYDDLGDVWLELFREDIFVSLLNLRQKAERTKAYMNLFSHDEVFHKVLSDFVAKEENENLDLPAFERLLPLLRSLGAKDDDNFYAVIAILSHAKSSKVKAEKSNQA